MGKTPRKRTPTEIELAVLDKSRRRCALCFQIIGDLTEKRGQIAHLDENPANYFEDNLAFLCLDHHSQYDSKTSQHKNYTMAELKKARDRLYEAIAQERHLQEERTTDVGFIDDRATLQAIIDAMGGETMSFLRDFDFGNPFDNHQLDGLRIVILDRNHAEHEFVDRELEALRKSLLDTGRTLLDLLATYAFPLKNNSPGWVKIPDEWEESDRTRFFARIKEMNDAANRVCASYRELVRAARSKLAR
jgi:hypothetical protein